MGETRLRRDVRRQVGDRRREIGLELRRLRLDAGLSRAAVARLAGVDARYVALIEDAERAAGFEALALVAAALGADLSVRLFAGTGPAVHDRSQAPMTEALLLGLHARWLPSPEVRVSTPARGVIDVVLDDTDGSVLVAAEIQGQVRRLEQQIRWHREKEVALSSADLWPFALAQHGGELATSRLLVLRASADLVRIATDYPATLAAAYPARCADALAALRGEARWPGPAIVWVAMRGRQATLMQGPPRGVVVGR